MTTNPTDTALWQRLVQWQPADAALIIAHCRALPDDWPLRVFGVGRPEAAMLLPPAATGEQFPNRIPEIAPYDEIAALHDCPACEEAEGNCRFHEGYAAGYHELSEAQREAVKARPDITLRDFMYWQADVAEAEDRGEEPPLLPAAAPMPDRVDIRDRIRRAICEHEGNGSLWGTDLLEPDEYGDLADAVLAVLPPTAPTPPTDQAAVCICGHTEVQHFEGVCITEVTGCQCGDYLPPDAAAEVIDRWRTAAIEARADRAAVLHAAADTIASMRIGAEDPTPDAHVRGYNDGLDHAEAELHRVADEAQQQEPAAHGCTIGGQPAMPILVAEYNRLMTRAAEAGAQQQPDTETRTPCSVPNPCDDGELCAAHEEEQAHAEGEHAFCSVTCEVAMPTALMRNSIVAHGIPGTAGMLDELLRRAAVGLLPTVEEPGPDVVAYRSPDRPGALWCRKHGARWWGLAPLASGDLPDGGVCGDCGVDVLISQPAAAQPAADGEATP